MTHQSLSRVSAALFAVDESVSFSDELNKLLKQNGLASLNLKGCKPPSLDTVRKFLEPSLAQQSATSSLLATYQDGRVDTPNASPSQVRSEVTVQEEAFANCTPVAPLESAVPHRIQKPSSPPMDGPTRMIHSAWSDYRVCTVKVLKLVRRLSCWRRGKMARWWLLQKTVVWLSMARSLIYYRMMKFLQ